MVVVGGGPVALLTALLLHQRGERVELVDATFTLPPGPFNPELVSMGNEEGIPGLYYNSVEQWEAMGAGLGLPAFTTRQMFLDLASSEGRETLLKEEAMLDALGGKNIVFETELPPFLRSTGLRGAKVWKDAPRLLPNTLAILREAVRQRGIAVHAAQVIGAQLTPLGVKLSDGAHLLPAYLVVADGAAARVVLSDLAWRLPLRPARGHVLSIELPDQSAPDALVLHRLKRGHLFLAPQPPYVHGFYDALLDPQQATVSQKADMALSMALRRHINALVPSLEEVDPRNFASVHTHWLTPDFQPAFGPWPEHPQVMFAVGWMGREGVFAAGVARDIAQHHATQAFNHPAVFAPNRFASGLWQSVTLPSSLNWKEPQQFTEVSMLSPTPEYAQNVQMVEKAEAQYANKVNQVEKNVQSTTEKATPQLRERIKRPKVQAAPLRKG